jgi:hypothetical protein
MTDSPTWAVVAKLQNAGPGRGIFATLFFLWGFLGLLVNAVNFVGMPNSVGVGTSMYVAAGILLWIGGMVLFGIGALITGRLDFLRRE